jgi:hypothetical protein
MKSSEQGSPAVPDFVTHYHLPDRQPFLNLSSLSEKVRSVVLDELDGLRRTGEHQRVYGSRYMELRELTETKMFELFVRAGGKPERAVPHYFVLGSSDWFRGLARHMKEMVVPISLLPIDATSFTYPDSFTAMALGPRFGLPHEPRPYHEKVFRIDRLSEIVGRYGEVQLWTDVPLTTE